VSVWEEIPAPILYEAAQPMAEMRIPQSHVPRIVIHGKTRRNHRFSPSPGFWTGCAVGLGIGFLVFTALGRQMVKTAAGLTEAELRRRIEEVRARRGL